MKFPLLEPTNKAEQTLRISKVRTAMSRYNIDAMLLASSVNIFYLTGGVCRGYFYLTMDKDPLFFMIPPAEASYSGELNIRKPEQISSELEKLGFKRPKIVGLEYADLLYSDVERLKKVFEGAEFADGSKVMREARLKKTEYEISLLREDGMKHCKAYSKIKHCYHKGMTDVQFQIEIERQLRLAGCLGYLRVAGSSMEINLGSVIAGDNAEVPSPYDFTMGGAGTDPSLPVGAAGLELKPGMAIMIDMNGGFNGYQTDMTRCWSLGVLPDFALNAHACSRKILRELEREARPGVEIGELYRIAERIAEEDGFADYFMGHSHKVKFIGHGVGIELNEAPVIMQRNKSLLEENMTLAIEPKFVIPGVGGLGIENTYVVRKEGLENLTPFEEDVMELGIRS